MNVACFMIERRNERRTQRPCDCDDSGCDVVVTDTVFDVVRLDTGDTILADVESYYGLPVGSMWWAQMGQSDPPTGPDDWAGYSDDHLELVRASAARHPERSGPINPATGLPARAPSHLFASGPQLDVRTPGGVWTIDSRASNCGRPYDYTHRCWVRHGEPPNITVDKNGDTCTAGAGSIQCGNYHGFLRNGELTDCPEPADV